MVSDSSLIELRASVPVYLLYNYGDIFHIPKLVCMESNTDFEGKFDVRVVVRVQPYSSIQFSG